MWKVVVVLVLLGLTASAAPEKPDYTEDLEKFKSDRHKERLELLVGSWLMAREHHPQAN